MSGLKGRRLCQFVYDHLVSVEGFEPPTIAVSRRGSTGLSYTERVGHPGLEPGTRGLKVRCCFQLS